MELGGRYFVLQRAFVGAKDGSGIEPNPALPI